MATIVMERVYDEPRTGDQIDAMNARIVPCLEVNGVTHLQTMVSRDRTRFICTFESPDAEAVRRAIESSGIAYHKIYPVDVFTSG